MPHIKRQFLNTIIALAILFSSLPLNKVSAAEALALNNGTLVRTESSPKVYYIEDGFKRWIDSWETLVAQGLRSREIIILSPAGLDRYPEGSVVTAESNLILEGEREILPDLIPLPANELLLAKKDGRSILRFTARFVNKGKGPLELISNAKPDSTDEYLDTYQHLVQKDGTVRDKAVGNFLWHEAHKHYHYSHFADYTLQLVKLTSGETANAPKSITEKTTFCMRDDLLFPGAVTQAPKTFTVCGKYRQGVSAGWIDQYRYTLPDQFIDVHDLPPGIYSLSFNVDPVHHFVEESQKNNSSVVFFELNAKLGLLKIIATASAAGAENRFPNGMLVRAALDTRIYVINYGRKRLLSNPPVGSLVYDLDQGIFDAIPGNTVVKTASSGNLYIVNASGYRRRILNPEVFKSYGFTALDISTISEAELASIPPTDYIMRQGTTDVFSIATKQYVSSFDNLNTLGIPPGAVHIVNDTDFNNYATKIIAQNLTVPWDIVFLPGGDLLVTERPGTLRRIGKENAIIKLPGVLQGGEGGLMGMALHPKFNENNLIYLYFTTTKTTKVNRVQRFKFENNQLLEDKIIIDDIPSALYHDGGQIAFGPDGMLYISTGDAEIPAAAQDLTSLAGKTLRLTPEGEIPSDNPFGDLVWSYGHRNAQGIAWDNLGRLWETEHGRSGALSGMDEVNLIAKGKNYGWPDIQGDETKTGMTTPVINSGANVTWAPSGLAFADGHLYFAGLRGVSLYRTAVAPNGELTNFRALFPKVYGRLRAVVVGPDGFVYFTTSNRDGRGTPKIGDDKIIRVHQDFFR